ncbi:MULTISPECIES: hypothetical protein [Providencia]|uniref:hypothetical protein n=1 Tax=Providencia TaxID=586 RepID=UPI00234B9A24|nr:hypothetical protein [Providencia sp. PROV273]
MAPQGAPLITVDCYFSSGYGSSGASPCPLSDFHALRMCGMAFVLVLLTGHTGSDVLDCLVNT